MRKSNLQIGALLMATLMVMGLFFVSPSVSAAGRAAGVHVEVTDTFMINNDQIPVAANNTATVTIEVRNIGDAVDSFNISAEIIQSPDGLWTSDQLDVAGSGADNTTLDNVPVYEDEGDEVTFEVDVMAPDFAAPLDMAIIDVTVQSHTDGTVMAVQSVNFVLQNWTAYIDGKFEFDQGEDYNYTLKVKNLDEKMPFDASIHPITFSSTTVSSGWEVLFPGTEPQRETWNSTLAISEELDAGEELTYKVNLMLAETVKADENVTFSIEGACEPGGVSPAPEPSTTPLGLSFVADVLPFYKIGPLQVDKTQDMVGMAGGTITYTFKQVGGDGGIRNFGNVEDTFTLDLDDTNLPAGWSATLDKSTTGVLDWKNSFDNPTTAEAEVTITAPTGEVAGTQGVVRMTATSDGMDTVSTYRDLTLEISQDYDISIAATGNKTAVVDPGVTKSFNIEVTNDGNGDDTVELEISMVTGKTDDGWVTMLKQAGTEIMNVTVAPFDSETIILEVMVPADAKHQDASGNIKITATSEDGETDEDVTFSVEAAQTYGVSLMNGTNITAQTKEQCDTFEFSLDVTNDGNGIDTIAVTIPGTIPDWVNIKVGTSDFPGSLDVASEQTRTLIISGEIPTDATAGKITITATATSEDGTTTDTFNFDLTVADKVCPSGTTRDGCTCDPDKIPSGDDDDDDDDSPGFAMGVTVLALLAAMGISLRRRH